MSSLRRRAIVVSRARSAERSSIGGRVSARAAAAESPGSASTRSQAIASRTSGAGKSAAAPETWKGMPRSSIAAADGAAALGRVVDQHADRLPARARSAIRCSTRGPPPAPGALVLAAPEAQLGVAELLVEDYRLASGVGSFEPRPPVSPSSPRRRVRASSAASVARIAR
jgi:hypothetical protein